MSVHDLPSIEPGAGIRLSDAVHPPPPGGSSVRPLRARLATVALFLVNGIGIGSWAGGLPTLQQQLDLTNQMLSLALMGFAAGAVASMLTAARLAGRFGVDRIALAAAAVFTVALVLPPLAPSLPVLVAAAVLLGLSNGLLDVSMNTNATTVEQAWGAPVMSSFHAMFSVGGMAGALGVSLLLRLGLGLSGSLALAAVVMAALTIVSLAVGLRGGLPAFVATADEFPLLRWPRPAVLRIGALAFMAMLVEGAMADWSGVFMSEVTGVSTAFAAAAYAAFSVAMVAGRVFGDRIVHALGPARLLGIGALTVSAAVVVAVALPYPAVALVCFAVCGLGLSNLVPVLFSAGARATPDRPEEGVAGAAMGGYAGFLFGPVIIGAAAYLVGLHMAILLLPAAGAILALSAPRLVRASEASTG